MVYPQFGALMRALLDERGLSYRALAERTHFSKSYLQEVAAAKKPPTLDVAQRVDAALDAGGELVALARQPDRVPLDRPDWRRTDNELLAAELVATAPSPDSALALAHEWLIAEPPQVYELRAGRRIGEHTVSTVEQRVRQLRLLDDHIGGSQTHTIVATELAATAQLLGDAAYTESVGRRLLVAVADLCQLAGFVAADAGLAVAARRYHLAGVRAAHAAGDRESAANNLSSVSYIAANIGDRREAVVLARSAYVGAGSGASPTGRALLLERAAWAHARAADAAAAGRALVEVEDAYAHHEPDLAPTWAYWLTPDEVEIMAGRVWTQLRRPLRALPILERAVARYGDDVPRETALYLTWLAEALLQAGEVEAAAAAAVRALRMARRSRSARASTRVDLLHSWLTPHVATPEVAAFHDEYRTVSADSADD